MTNVELENWLPMPPNQGPPLPRSLEIYWPWYKPPEIPPEEIPPEEIPPNTVQVRLKNPPSGANEWQLTIYDRDEVDSKRLSNFYLGIEEPAVFDIPPEWVFPLRVDMLIYSVTNGAVAYYRMYSITWPKRMIPEFYREEYIPEYGEYYFNVSTERFEKV